MSVTLRWNAATAAELGGDVDCQPRGEEISLRAIVRRWLRRPDPSSRPHANSVTCAEECRRGNASVPQTLA
jgi:hypothetical protein